MVCNCLQRFVRFVLFIDRDCVIELDNLVGETAGCLADIKLTGDHVSDETSPIFLDEVDLSFYAILTPQHVRQCRSEIVAHAFLLFGRRNWHPQSSNDCAVECLLVTSASVLAQGGVVRSQKVVQVVSP